MTDTVQENTPVVTRSLVTGFNMSLGCVDISDYVILSDQKERGISYFALNLSSLPEIPRRLCPLGTALLGMTFLDKCQQNLATLFAD